LKIFSFSWLISTFVSTLVTMVFIYLIKKGSEKWNIPIVKTVSEGI